jgi:hypothetical protein
MMTNLMVLEYMRERREIRPVIQVNAGDGVVVNQPVRYVESGNTYRYVEDADDDDDDCCNEQGKCTLNDPYCWILYIWSWWLAPPIALIWMLVGIACVCVKCYEACYGEDDEELEVIV